MGKIACEILGEERSPNLSFTSKATTFFFSMASQLQQPQTVKVWLWNNDAILSLGACFSKGNYYNVTLADIYSAIH